MFTIYVLLNSELNKIYIGHTLDLEKRLARHNGFLPTKSTSYTARNKGLWKVVYKEDVETRKEAILREKQLKSYQGRKFIRDKILGP